MSLRRLTSLPALLGMALAWMAGAGHLPAASIRNVVINPPFLCPGQAFTVTYEAAGQINTDLAAGGILSANNSFAACPATTDYGFLWGSYTGGTGAGADPTACLNTYDAGATIRPGNSVVAYLPYQAVARLPASWVGSTAYILMGVNDGYSSFAGFATWDQVLAVQVEVNCQKKQGTNTFSFGSSVSNPVRVVIQNCGTPSNTPSYTRTSTPTPTRSSTPTSTATATRSNTPSYTPTPTATATRSNTPTYTSTATPSVSSTSTATRSNTPTSTATATFSFTFTSTATRSSTPTSSATQSPGPSPTYTATVTSTATRSSTPTSTATATFSFTFTSTATRSSTPTVSNTQSPGPSPTFTASFSATPTATATRTATGTFTATATRSATPTVSNTQSPGPSPTFTATSSASPTPSSTATASNTFTATATRTATPTVSHTQSPGPSPTFTATSSASPTVSSTPTASNSFTSTATLTATHTITPSATQSPANSPTATATSSATRSATPTFSASATASNSSTATPSSTASPTRTATPSATSSLSNTPTATASGTATVSFTPSETPVPQPFHVSLGVYNSAGELVRLLFDGAAQILPDALTLSDPGLAAGQGSISVGFPGQWWSGGTSYQGALSWDGRNSSGQTVSGGAYVIKAEFKDPFGKVSTKDMTVQVLGALQQVEVQVFNSAGELVARHAMPTLDGASSMLLNADQMVVGDNSNALKVTVQDGRGSVASWLWQGEAEQGGWVAGGVYLVKVMTLGPGGGRADAQKSISVLGMPDDALAQILASAVLGPNPLSLSAAQGLQLSYLARAGFHASARIYSVAGEAVAEAWDSRGSGQLNFAAGAWAHGIYMVDISIWSGQRILGHRILKLAVGR